MARARGSNATLAVAFEATYGTPPGSGFRRLAFASANLGERQGLIENELIGMGREPQAPVHDVVNNEGDIVVPMDSRNLGVWLRGLMGSATVAAAFAASGSIAFAAQPAPSSTLTINGATWTFVSSAPTGNQTLIGANLAATLTALATNLNASVVAQITPATYSATATALTIVHDTLGPTGNGFTLAAQAASNGTVSGTTLTGGANTHTWVSGAQTLPSLAIEIQLPEVPAFAMTYGARVNRFQAQAQRSGQLMATVGIIAQGETIAAAAQAGTLTTLNLDRFGQFQGEIKRNGVALGNVVSADFTYANNLEKVEVIRADGRIADADPGLVTIGGNVVTRFEDRVLLDQATARDPCELSFGWQIDAGRKVLWTFHRVFLPRGDRAIQGPGGVQVPFAFQAALDPVLGKSATCVLTNDVTSY